MNNSIIDNNLTNIKHPFSSVGKFLALNRAELAQKIPCSIACVGIWESGEGLPQGSKLFACLKSITLLKA